MKKKVIADSATAYFDNEELHLFFLCTTKEKDKTRRLQWIVERELGGYVTVWTSHRSFSQRDGKPIDPNALNTAQEAIDVACTGTYMMEIAQCYTAEQAICELGRNPEEFTIERIGYYPGIRQARARIYPAELAETAAIHSVRDARAAIYRTLKSKGNPKLLTLSEIRDDDETEIGRSLLEETPFANLKWTGEPFPTGKFKTANLSGLGRYYYDENDNEY